MKINYNGDLPTIYVEEDSKIRVDLEGEIFLSKVTDVYADDDDAPYQLFQRTITIQDKDATIAIELTSLDRDALKIKAGKSRNPTKLAKKGEPPPDWLYPKVSDDQEKPEE